MRRIKARHIIELLIHLAFWIGMYYTMNSLTSSTMKMRVSHNGTIVGGFDAIFHYSGITLVFMALLFYGNIFWILKKALRYKSLLAGIAAATSWLILTFTANYIIVGPKLNENLPLPPPPPNFGSHKGGPDHLVLNDTAVFTTGNGLHMQLTLLLVFLAIAGLSIAYFFLKEWARNELVRNQREAYQLSTEIKFLKSQINPHFLFNTLNNLFSMAQDNGNDKLADGISKLSGMMRYMIYESNAETVPLKNEIEYIKSCIALNKLRYADDEALVNFKYSEQVPDVFIAPMIFIPFIENAFKHGVLINNTSPIDISIAVNDKALLFICENKNYSFVKKMENDKSGIGLENVKRRLDLVYPGKHELIIKNDENLFHVELKIDLS
jgi:two-component system LytT family sensor kinase